MRLCYKGLHQKDDAHIYIRCSVLENILSYYSSPFADDESKMLILQVSCAILVSLIPNFIPLSLLVFVTCVLDYKQYLD